MTSNKQEKKPWLKVILFNLLCFGIIIVITELIYGGWLHKDKPLKVACVSLYCSAKFEYDSPTFGKTKFSKDKYGLRGRKSSNSDIDIVVVGGSTTDERSLDDKQEWAYVLEQEFIHSGKSIEIVNAGIGGQSTYGHIWNFNKWFPHIPNFSPKYILFYLGINDIDFRHRLRFIRPGNIPGNSKIWYDIKQLTFKVFDDIRGLSFFYEILRNIKGTIAASKAGLSYRMDVSDVIYEVEFDSNKNNWDNYKNDFLKEEFVPRLKELLRLTRKIGAEPIFVTQRTARWVLKEGKIFGQGANTNRGTEIFKGKKYFFNSSDIGFKEKLLSDSVLEFCEKNKLLCIDGFSNFPINNNTTSDLTHTNAEGSRKIAEKLFELLKPRIQL